MKSVIFALLAVAIMAGCASKVFDQDAYDRQNKAAEKNLNTL